MGRSERTPTDTLKKVYDQLGQLLDRGDNTFIEEGPSIVKDALSDPAFLEGIETESAVNSYTRAKVLGAPGEHIIRFMEWPPEYTLMPHEHNGRPCFEVLVEGTLVLTDMELIPVSDDRYELKPRAVTVCHEGDAGVIDPRNGNDVHAVYSPERTRSLHIYPDDKYYAYGYVPENPNDPHSDYYLRERFELDTK